mgnify:CR=1 FL=1
MINRWKKFFKHVYGYSVGIITLVFTFIPESAFTYGFFHVDCPEEVIITCNRLLCLFVFFISISLITYCSCRWRKSVKIKGNDYTILVEYGDLFRKDNCKKVIAFDECYSTNVGSAPADIKPHSICGQFLAKYPGIGAVIQSYGLKHQRKHSEYQNKKCFESGSIIPVDDYLLLAFAKLDKEGLGRMTREEFLSCLNLMWKEIDRHHCQQSVALPILGSGITRFKDETLTQQQLLDMIIASYKLSPDKLNPSATLHIVCKEDDNFSLNKIGEYV